MGSPAYIHLFDFIDVPVHLQPLANPYIFSSRFPASVVLSISIGENRRGGKMTCHYSELLAVFDFFCSFFALCCWNMFNDSKNNKYDCQLLMQNYPVYIKHKRSSCFLLLSYTLLIPFIRKSFDIFLLSLELSVMFVINCCYFSLK